MDLFSMGVFDDEDRPKQHKPAPVRCLEVELLPALPKVPKCATCQIDPPIRGRDICLHCERDQKQHKTSTTYAEDTKFMRLRARMICSGGVLVVEKRTMKTMEDFIDAGNARWANQRDLHRLGRPDDGKRVALLIGWQP